MKKRMSMVVSIVVCIMPLCAMEDIELKNFSQDVLSINSYESISAMMNASINKQQGALINEYASSTAMAPATHEQQKIVCCLNCGNEYYSKEFCKTLLAGSIAAVLNFGVVAFLTTVLSPCLGYSAQAVVCSPNFLCANALCSEMCLVCPFCCCNLADVYSNSN